MEYSSHIVRGSKTKVFFKCCLLNINVHGNQYFELTPKLHRLTDAAKLS